MIPNLAYNSKDLYISSNQVRTKPTYLSGLDATDLYNRGFYYLVNALTVKADICIRKKS